MTFRDYDAPMGRAWVAGVCAALGVYLLAGPGWALLALAAVTYLTPIPARVRAAALATRSRATREAGRVWRWLRGGRHQVAVALMVVGLALLPVAVNAQFGIAWAVGVIAVSLVGLALLVGWDPKPAAP